MKRTYDIRPPIPDSARTALAAHPELLSQLLFHRGVQDASSAEVFLSPDYDTHRHDPFLMKDMEKAVERLFRAIKTDERIVVYSDYDADGVPGGVLFHDFLKKVGHTNFENYIPDRHGEGFGLNHDAIDAFVTSGTTLLITIDCGITDADELEKAISHGIDVIVTDHHTPPEKLPRAVAVLDPKRADCEYPFKELCGSGVIFKLVEAFLKRYGDRFNVPVGWEKWLLDMVGIATLSDMVPLSGENRVLAHYGLMVLRKTRRPGLGALFSLLKINRVYLSEDDVGFMITPRINAASRLGKVQDAFTLLSTTDPVEGGVLAIKLDEINDERKGIVASLVKELKKIARERVTDRRVLVIGNPDWRPSLLGLVANTLVEEYRMPVFLWGRDGDGVIKGSCRAPSGMNVVLLMREAAKVGVLDDFGGHHEAGGFRVAPGKVHLLDEVFERACDVLVSSPESAALPYVDAVLSLEDVTVRTYQMIASLAPFGVGNKKPVFLFTSVPIVGMRVFGKQKNHLELSFQTRNNALVKAIGFFAHPDSYGVPLTISTSIDLVASFEQSFFGGRVELRLRIVDII